jgi:hypothetical protein
MKTVTKGTSKNRSFIHKIGLTKFVLFGMLLL